MGSIYLDYAATTPVAPEVLEAMMPYFKDKYGNPSSVHAAGRKAKRAVDDARERIADYLGCGWQEIIFTGSATEANNLALRGANRPHIVTTKIEHESVLKTCEDLEKRGVRVTYLPVAQEGIVSPQQVREALSKIKDPALVSVVYANNEIGAINPIDQMQVPLLHTDAVQALNYLDVNVAALGVDMMSLSAHKIYGPKGIGLLYVKAGTSLHPIITGGAQEGGRRAGTENVPAIVGFAKAVDLLADSRAKEGKRLRSLRDYFITEIRSRIPGAILHGPEPGEKRLPNNLNFCFERKDKTVIPGDSLVIALDLEGVYASWGSACTAGAAQPSHVVRAVAGEEKARGAVRFSLGRYTEKKDIDKVVGILEKVIEKIA